LVKALTSIYNKSKHLSIHYGVCVIKTIFAVIDLSFAEIPYSYLKNLVNDEQNFIYDNGKHLAAG